MAYPRPARSERIYMVTRRCVRREYLLRPDVRVNQAVRYCFAEAAAHKGNNVEVLWLDAESNHLHYGIYDPDGTYPKFTERFHKLLAKALNKHWNRRGPLFEYEQTNVVELCDAGAVFDKMIYCLTNSVKDRLVARVRDWPGVCSLQAQLDDAELVIKRPSWYFKKDGEMPESVTLRFRRPPPFRQLAHRDWAKMIKKAVRRCEREARRAGGPVLGRQAVLNASPSGSPVGAEETGAIKPTVAARDPQVRAEARATRKAWRAAYRRALETYREGESDVVFPAGTYKLWHECHVLRAPEA